MKAIFFPCLRPLPSYDHVDVDPHKHGEGKDTLTTHSNTEEALLSCDISTKVVVKQGSVLQKFVECCVNPFRILQII